ncbi:MAG: hypothetical protein QXG03_01705 [Halalkalicoccus sp.]
MATVSVRIPDRMKEKMDQFPEVNWSAVLRNQLEAELDRREGRDIARAVLVSERLSNSVDPDSLGEYDSAETIRTYRDSRHGPEEREDG